MYLPNATVHPQTAVKGHRYRGVVMLHDRDPSFRGIIEIGRTEPRANWSLVGGQSLVEMASKRYIHIESVPGNDKSNPDFEYFVLVIQIGASGRQDPSKMY